MDIRVGYIKDATMALGPGCRFVIWTQGCLRRCKDCASPEHQPLDGGYLIDTKELADWICSCRSIDGITISGGEPFLQANALYELTEMLKLTRPELNVIVFTGNLLKDLTDEDSKAFLRNIDLLIDGEYISELNDGVGLRGSSNQRFHYLTERLVSYQNELEGGIRNTEVYWTDETRKRMVTIGVPKFKHSIDDDCI